MPRLVIEESNIRQNADILKNMCGASEIIGVVKGNGYGLGAERFALLLSGCGITRFAVSSVEEGERLRDAGIGGEILLLSATSINKQAERAVSLDLTLTIASPESALAVSAAAIATGKKAFAHIKIDVGFGRYGFLPSEAEKVAQVIKGLTDVEITGIFGHFPASFGSAKQVKAQLMEFEAACRKLSALGIDVGCRHIANSCAALKFADTRLDAVRIGSALLGRPAVKNKYGLKRVGRLEAAIDEIRYLPKGHNVGYANVYRTKKDTKIAVIGAGTAHGLFCTRRRDAFRFADRMRYIFNDIKFLIGARPLRCVINGRRANVLGRVGLTNLVVDVTGLDVLANDIAVFEVNPIFVDGTVERYYEDSGK